MNNTPESDAAANPRDFYGAHEKLVPHETAQRLERERDKAIAERPMCPKCGQPAQDHATPLTDAYVRAHPVVTRPGTVERELSDFARTLELQLRTAQRVAFQAQEVVREINDRLDIMDDENGKLNLQASRIAAKCDELSAQRESAIGALQQMDKLTNQLAAMTKERDAALVPICIGPPLIRILATEGQWVRQDGRGLVAADGLFGHDPFAERDAALAALKAVLSSASPSKSEHPKMFAAWEHGNSLLATHAADPKL